MIGNTEISTAYQRISNHVLRTPVLELDAGRLGLPNPVSLKLELLQHSGSFKARGAFNRILANTVPESGVIAASGGNHGAATAYAAQALGYPAEVFVPTISSPAKVERIKRYGAKIAVEGLNYAEALQACFRRANQSGALWVSAYETEETLAGQGTVALEWEQQSPGLNTVLVAVGGGGLIAGIAAWFAGRVKVVGVEPLNCPTLYQALRAGHPVEVATSGLAADSLGARQVGELAFEIAQSYVQQSLLVSDQDIKVAQQWLWRELQLATEPGGAAAMAALLSGAYVPKSGERVGVLLCGANVDLRTLG